MKNPLLFNYGVDALTTGSALAIARGELKAELNDQARKAIEKSRASVQSIVEDDREFSTVQHLDQVFESIHSFTKK